jgi:ferritin-like metal-binding protein YciE
MDPKTLLIKQLDEAHAMETALVTNLTAHAAMTTDTAYRKLLKRHQKETREQVEAIEKRRGELGASGGRGILTVTAGLARDAVGQALVMSKGPLDAMRTVNQQERMLKNAKDECATEALEIATYDALEATAVAAGDSKTAKLAVDHRKQEERMLADLRKQIGLLAKQTFEARTDERAQAAVTKASKAKPKRRAKAKAKAKPRARASA